jgi:hypothetical protein
VIEAESISGVAFLTPDKRAKLTSTTIFGKLQLALPRRASGRQIEIVVEKPRRTDR